MNLRYATLVTPVLLGVVAAAAVAAGPKPAPSPTAAPPATAPSKYQQQSSERLHNSAPADEYFGKLKMSFLGINNTLRDSALASGEHTTDVAIAHKISFAEDALQDWEKKYPRDPQLARTYFLAIAAEKKIWLKDNQERAWSYMNRILSVFPTTFFGKQVKRDLGVGFTEHYYDNPVPCPTQAPTSTPTPPPAATPVPAPSAPASRRGGAPPSPAPAPKPTPSPAPTAEPTPSPVPTPRVTQLEKGLSVQLEIPACIPPATPAPAAPASPAPASPAPASPAPALPPASSPPK